MSVLLTFGCAGEDAVSSILATSNEPAGSNCPAGGLRVDTGPDANGNGALDASEIANTNYLCSGSNGSDGENGANGLQTLVVTTVEPDGVSCVAGGQRIDYGVDDDADGVLDAGEVDGTSYACDGVDGLESLITSTPVAASLECPYGGHRIDYGIDDDGDGVLDAGEIDGDAHVCHACQGGMVEVTKDFTALGSFTTPSLDLDEVVITGAPTDINVIEWNGLGVTGGELSGTTVDGSESLTYEFARPATGVSYTCSYNGFEGDAEIEAFGADGASLGTADVAGFGPHDVSTLFGGAALSSFVVTALGDGHRTSSLTFTTCN